MWPITLLAVGLWNLVCASQSAGTTANLVMGLLCVSLAGVLAIADAESEEDEWEHIEI